MYLVKQIKKILLPNELSQTAQTFLMGMLGALLVVLIMQCVLPRQKTIATIDITNITRQFIKDEQSKNLPLETIKSESGIFAKNLEKSLKVFSIKNNLILVPKEAVLAGTEDDTRYINQLLRDQMPHEDTSE